MAWDDGMIIPLRVLINDTDSGNYTYTDEVLQKLLVTAASQVQQEVSLTTTYTIDYNTPQITPDPSGDDLYNTFVVMKAACLKNQWDFSAKAVSGGVRARCGPVQMQTDAGSASVLTALLNEGFCAAYSELKLQHNFGNSGKMKAVLSPFTHDDYRPAGISGSRTSS